LAALQVFRFFGASFRTFPIADLSNIKLGSKLPAFLYSIPTFQNPSGHCYSNSERMALAKFCDDNRILLLEDDPYRDLVFDKCDRKPVVSLLKNTEWIYQGSFSKNLAPGLRLGYLAASKELVPYLVRLKQAADLHSNRLSQWLVNQQLLSPAREQRINDLCDTYRTKRNRFDDALHHYFGDIAIWTKPAGGLFFWLELNRKIDTRLLLPKAIERNVIFMPGENFYADASDGIGTMRLNFSLMDSNQTEIGLKRLSELIRLA
jgi:DNA-binding transcriptional MocR family regulator